MAEEYWIGGLGEEMIGISSGRVIERYLNQTGFPELRARRKYYAPLEFNGIRPNSDISHLPQSEALQSDPTNACGSLHYTRKADHVEKRDPRGDDNKR